MARITSPNRLWRREHRVAMNVAVRNVLLRLVCPVPRR
jgi:hypothetical protein